MAIPTESYEIILEKYRSSVAWFASLGIEVQMGRTAHYEKVIRYWKDAYQSATAEEGEKIFPDFVSSMFEVFDFISIFQSLVDVPHAQLKAVVEQLKKGVNGPINAADEKPESTTARNFLFEAVVCAKAHSPDRGIQAIFNTPSDAGILISERKLWVECKRLTSVTKIESNVRKASNQLELVLKGMVGSGHRGIVALDISKILNRGDKIFVAPNDRKLLASINRLMDNFIERNSHVWERVYANKSKKIIGTIVRFQFMATSEARNILVHASQWAVNPRRGIKSSDEEVLQNLVSALKDQE
jgi:hypothetical protein